jgi:hypothetical protein
MGAADIFAPYTGQGPLGALADELGLSQKELARAQFLTWLKETNPAVFRHALQVAETAKAHFAAQTGNPAALSGLGWTMGADGGAVAESKTWWQSLAEGITQAGTAYLAYKGQKANIELNLRRAEQGLAPIDYSRYTAPTLRTQVDVSPEILARIKESGMNTLLLVGGVLAAVLVLPRLLGGGRGRR